ncbi:MAG: adenylyltransferase/cytidyltransferase family protein, partial [Ruminiclostridium sp.]|nr:adenylyltransferase/cytidyltransferase family protein [Ruminiclostridium sp.]
MKKVYACFTTDVIHDGHLNIINKAKEYGEVIIGVLSDEAMVKFDRFPAIPFEERMELIKSTPGVDRVIKQDDIMYDKVIEEIRPDYVIHGDNWLTGATRAIRDNVEGLLSEYGGQIIDVPYTYNENVRRIDAKVREKLAMPEFRRKRLHRLLELRPIVKALEVHSGITGLIAEKTVVSNGGILDQFDAMWISSLCDSTAKGKPDIELVDMTSRFRTIED